MLVLGRQAGQSVRIGEDVTIYVVEITGRRVRLAFDAPADVKIMRSELTPWEAERFESRKGTTLAGSVG